MTFSEDAWDDVQDWYAAIVAHPFVTGLADGSLPTDVFTRYLVDDAHYLGRYARVLATLSTRAPDPDLVAELAEAAHECVRSERSLHTDYLVTRGIAPDAGGVPEPTPTCAAYTGALALAASYAPLEVGMAAVLPCFRIYAEVGYAVAEMPGASASDHPYRGWIDTYADPAFAAVVSRVEGWSDRLADAASPGLRTEMLGAYRRATRYEWMFFDASWRGETWPAP